MNMVIKVPVNTRTSSKLEPRATLVTLHHEIYKSSEQTEELKNHIESFQRPGYSEIGEQPKRS